MNKKWMKEGSCERGMGEEEEEKKGRGSLNEKRKHLKVEQANHFLLVRCSICLFSAERRQKSREQCSLK